MFSSTPTQSHEQAWISQLGLLPHNNAACNQDAGILEQKAVSQYAVRRGLSLPELVRRRRGDDVGDPRPNKALDPDRLRLRLHGYSHVDTLVAIARQGICPLWTSEGPPRRKPPENHKSARLFSRSLLKSIRHGQANGAYLVVNLSLLHQWQDVQCSPFRAVEKKGVDPQLEVRPIHDLSFPESTSTNDFFDATCAPDTNYISVAALARRIEWHATTNPSMNSERGRKSAVRHLMFHAEHVRWMGATFPAEDVLVIDLSAPFGWSGSPAYYGAFGGAITWLVGTNSPATVSDSDDSDAFFGYEWVDDHILIEPDRDNRLELAESTLRLSMMTVLGPNSINDAKFSPWPTELQALGLVWNTVDRTVSMPLDKVQNVVAELKRYYAPRRSSSSSSRSCSVAFAISPPACGQPSRSFSSSSVHAHDFTRSSLFD